MYAHPILASVAVGVFGRLPSFGPIRHAAGLFSCRICRGVERAVYNPFLSSMMLALEAQKVIELRLVRLAWGGREGRAEMQSMVVEKILAGIEATGTLMMGGSPETVIARYREHVATNTKRLLAA